MGVYDICQVCRCDLTKEIKKKGYGHPEHDYYFCSKECARIFYIGIELFNIKEILNEISQIDLDFEIIRSKRK